MLTTIELEPGEFRETFLADSAEETVQTIYVRHAKAALGEAVLSPDFRADSVPGVFLRSVQETTPVVVAEALRSEEYRIEDSQFLTKRIGSMGIGEDAVMELVPDPTFVGSIEAQIEAMPTNLFEEIEPYHQALEANGTLELFRNVHEARQSGADDWIDRAYRLVEEAADSSASRVSPEDTDALYLMTFIPHDVRRLTRRLIVGNTVFDRVSRRIGPDPSEDDARMLDALRQVFIGEALTGQQWRDVAEDSPLGESTALSIAERSIMLRQALATINEMAREGRGLAVRDAWQGATEALEDRLLALSRESQVSGWKLIDVGHCYEGFSNWSLPKVFGLTPELSNKYEVPQKTGRTAAILEDDTIQRAMWRDAVAELTGFDAPDELSRSEPAKFEDLADDPNTGLFLIDIKNGDDDSCGIRIGEEVLRRLVGRLAPAVRRGEDPEPTTVVIWSTSQESVDAASDHFKTVLEELTVSMPIAYSLSHSELGTRSPLYLEVQTKDWSSLTVK